MRKHQELRGILLELKDSRPALSYHRATWSCGREFLPGALGYVLACQWNGCQHNCYQEEGLPREWHGYDLPRIMDWRNCTKRRTLAGRQKVRAFLD